MCMGAAGDVPAAAGGPVRGVQAGAVIATTQAPVGGGADHDYDAVCPKETDAMNLAPELELPGHSRFSHPRDVVENRALPADEKRRILLDWLQDELALIVADNEGMVGHLLPAPDQVLAALQALGQATEVWRRAPWPAR